MKTIVIGFRALAPLIVVSIALAACTKSSAAKTYKCDRLVNLWCKVANNDEACNEVLHLQKTEMDPNLDHALQSETAATMCEQQLNKWDRDAQVAGHKDAEAMFAKTFKKDAKSGQ